MADLVDLWQKLGANVITHEFAKSLDISHNSISPLEDPAKRQIVYDKILKYVGEQP